MIHLPYHVYNTLRVTGLILILSEIQEKKIQFLLSFVECHLLFPVLELTTLSTYNSYLLNLFPDILYKMNEDNVCRYYAELLLRPVEKVG